VGDGDGAIILCTTTPRVIKDIRTNDNSKWLEVNEYADSVRKFTSEAGMWAGVRFVKSNRLKLWNHGNPTTATTVAVASNPGEGAKSTVDVVYTVGQTAAKQYLEVTAADAFTIGQGVTIHSQNALGADDEPLETDGTQETRRIVDIDTGNDYLYFNKPLLKAHAAGDQVTFGVDVHSSIFHGGPGVVYGVGERPHVILPPKYDDLMMVNRYGWRGFLKFQMFRPEFFEVVESAGSLD